MSLHHTAPHGEGVSEGVNLLHKLRLIEHFLGFQGVEYHPIPVYLKEIAIHPDNGVFANLCVAIRVLTVVPRLSGNVFRTINAGLQLFNVNAPHFRRVDGVHGHHLDDVRAGIDRISPICRGANANILDRD